MATCFSFIIIKVLGLVSSPNLTFHQVKTKVLPVAVVFSMSIMLVNQGQLRLTVSFLQVPQCAECLHPPPALRPPAAAPQTPHIPTAAAPGHLLLLSRC
jgi:hypothetical protein